VFTVDTHVHTCLSPCGDLDMHPAAVVDAAVARGLDAIAVCDHNSAANVAAVDRAGRRAGLAVLPGMEITSEEEVHIQAWLPDLDAAEALQARVYSVLPGRNVDAAFGSQVIANEDQEVLGFDEHLLSGATQWSVEEVVRAIHAAGGLAIAAHVDREAFGFVGQLGLIPPGLGLDALEVSAGTPLPAARTRFGGSRLPLVTGSDAHRPGEVGAAITLMLLERTEYGEVKQALEGRNGRQIVGGGRPMEDLALHILDVAQNAAEAGATRIEIDVVERLDTDALTIDIRDNGRGMDPATTARVTDPFFTTRTTRRVGMGLPLLAEAARAADGLVSVKSAPGRGTTVTAAFRHRHIDRAPLGDLETTLMALMAGHSGIDVEFRHAVGAREFAFTSADLREALGGQSLSSPEGLALLREAIRKGEAGLRSPVAQPD
jgi:anti-sigma regulatory factor (Ser/Thr protein kinase)